MLRYDFNGWNLIDHRGGVGKKKAAQGETEVQRTNSQPPLVTTEPARTALRLIGSVSRRIDLLARELNIRSHFDDPTGDDDRPRAA